MPHPYAGRVNTLYSKDYVEYLIIYSELPNKKSNYFNSIKDAPDHKYQKGK